VSELDEIKNIVAHFLRMLHVKSYENQLMYHRVIQTIKRVTFF